MQPDRLRVRKQSIGLSPRVFAPPNGSRAQQVGRLLSDSRLRRKARYMRQLWDTMLFAVIGVVVIFVGLSWANGSFSKGFDRGMRMVEE